MPATRRRTRLLPPLLAALFLLLAVLPAAAHDGSSPAAGLAAGFLHPLSGPDHLAALLLFGFALGRFEGRARFLLPLSLLAALAAGWLGGNLGGGIPLLPGATEAMIALSLPLLCLGLVGGRTLRPLPAGALAALFAFFHGTAHGLELSPGPAVAGFLAASLLLLLLPLALSRLVEAAAWPARSRELRRGI